MEAATPGPWSWQGDVNGSPSKARLTNTNMHDKQYILWMDNAIASELPLNEEHHVRHWAETLGACGLDAEKKACHNAMLIANAPTDISYLLTELSELKKAVKWAIGKDGYFSNLEESTEGLTNVVETEGETFYTETDKHHAQILLNTIKGGE